MPDLPASPYGLAVLLREKNLPERTVMLGDANSAPARAALTLR
jgi:hypothetical protein